MFLSHLDKKGHDKHIASGVPGGKTDVFSEKMS